MTATDVTPLAGAPTKIDSKLTNHSVIVNHCPHCLTAPAADLVSALQSSADATKAIRQLHASLSSTSIVADALTLAADTLPVATIELTKSSRALQLQLRALESDIRRGVACGGK